MSPGPSQSVKNTLDGPCLAILSKTRRVDRGRLRVENRDRFHSVCSVTNLVTVSSGGVGFDVVSRKTVSRMSRYRRLLSSLRAEGVESIYSHQLARHAVVSAAQVRRDLMVIGYSGSPNKGYDVDACIASIGSFLDGTVSQEVALVGVGNLGRAVLAHFEDKSSSVAIVAAFDVQAELTDAVVHGVRCFHARRMEILVRDLGLEIAVLTVPGEAAQEAADTLVRAGVKSLISFAPVPLHLPHDIFVEYMDITAALESAAYFARLGGREEPETNGGGEIEPMVKKLESLLARSKMKLEDLAHDIGPASSRPAGRAVPRSPRSTPVTASATSSTRPPTRPSS